MASYKPWSKKRKQALHNTQLASKRSTIKGRVNFCMAFFITAEKVAANQRNTMDALLYDRLFPEFDFLYVCLQEGSHAFYSCKSLLQGFCAVRAKVL